MGFREFPNQNTLVLQSAYLANDQHYFHLNDLYIVLYTGKRSKHHSGYLQLSYIPFIASQSWNVIHFIISINTVIFFFQDSIKSVTVLSDTKLLLKLQDSSTSLDARFASA